MLSENRKYHFIGELVIKRSNRILEEQDHPKDDVVNWFFLNSGEMKLSFVYKIDNASEAIYDKPFKVHLSFTMYERAKDIIKLNHTYEVLRGSEIIGNIRILKLTNEQ